MRDGYYFQCAGELYDTLRDVVLDVRYRQPQTAHQAHLQAKRRRGRESIARCNRAGSAVRSMPKRILSSCVRSCATWHLAQANSTSI